MCVCVCVCVNTCAVQVEVMYLCTYAFVASWQFSCYTLYLVYVHTYVCTYVRMYAHIRTTCTEYTGNVMIDKSNIIY